MKITVKKTELEFELMELKFAEAYENGIEKISRLESEVGSIPTLSGKIRKGCEIIGEVINSMFGDGTTDKLFGDKIDLKDYSITWLDITSQINMVASKENNAIVKLTASADSNA